MIDPSVQTFAGHLRNFLTQSGYPVREFQVVPHGSFGTISDTTAAGLAYPGQVSFDALTMSGLRSLAGRYGRRGRLTTPQADAFATALHEGIHQMQYGRNPDLFRGGRMTAGDPTNPMFWEEGATQAATEDLLPIASRKLFGDSVSFVGQGRVGGRRLTASEAYHERPNLPYAKQLMRIRQASTVGSGAGHWQDHAARAWRRSFSHADPTTRQRMLDEVTARRAQMPVEAI